MREIKRKKYFGGLFLLFLLVFGFLCGSRPARAESATPAPTPGATDFQEEPEKEDEKEEAIPQEYNLYIGQKISLPAVEEGKLVVQDTDIAELTKEDVLCAKAEGTTSVSLVLDGETRVYCRVRVKANELLAGISFDESSFPPCPVGAEGFSVLPDLWAGMNCRWSSVDSRIAKVDDKGFVTPVSAGKTWICVDVTDSYGGVYSFRIPVSIINPRFALSKLCVAKGVQTVLELKECTQVTKVTSSDNSKLKVLSFTGNGVVVKTYEKGSVTITGIFDGVTRTCQIIITAPKLSQTYGFYQKSKGVRLGVSGTNKQSTILWSSSDTKVATVTKKGYVRTRKKGSAVIHCEVDRVMLSYYLAVGGKTVVKAMRYGYRQVGKKHYSQARRMSKDYFDCSSYVYRCYRAAGKYLVRRTSWAPVAAEIGQYYVRKGKSVKASKVYSFNKLRPGDLICWGGKKARRNGRYKRIYHISLYIGNGKTMESSSTYNNVVIRDREPFRKVDVPVVVRPC